MLYNVILKTPVITLPEIIIPPIKIPDINPNLIPGIEGLPIITMPTITLPPVKIPEELNNIKILDIVPDIEIPNLCPLLSNVQLPPIKIPDIKISDITVPNLCESKSEIKADKDCDCPGENSVSTASNGVTSIMCKGQTLCQKDCRDEEVINPKVTTQQALKVF